MPPFPRRDCFGGGSIRLNPRLWSRCIGAMQSLLVTPTLIFWMNVLLVASLVWFSGCLFAAVAHASPGKSTAAGWRSGLYRLWYVQNRMWGLFFLIFGIQLIWLERFATNIPFWDQWGAEGLRLYLPLMQNELRLMELFHAHNEHRIFWTRVWAAGQFLLNEQWDPHFQSLMNALWQSAAGAVFCEILHRFSGRIWLWAWIPLTLVVFAAPHKGENILFAFQSQFYFLQFFGLASIFLLFAGRPLSVPWWTGWVGLIFSFFSLSGGVMLIGAVAVAAVLRIAFPMGERRWYLDLFWAAGALGLLAATYLNTPVVQSGDPARPETLSRLLSSFVHIMAWPIVGPRISTTASVLYGILLWGPWLGYVLCCFGNRKLREREGVHFLVVLTVGGWMLAVALAAAYSRGNLNNMGYNGRYADIFGLGFLLYAFLAFRIFAWRHYLPWTLVRNALLCISFGVWVVGLYFHNVAAVERLLPWFKDFQTHQVRNTDGYMKTGDTSYFQVESRLHLPFIDPDRARILLDDPVFRRYLPYTIGPVLALEQLDEGNDPAPFLEGGVPESVEERPGERVWGSFHPELGEQYKAHSRFRLKHPQRLPYLVFFLAGNPRAEGHRLLLERSPGDVEAVWRTLPGDHWLERRIFVGRGEVYLEARDASPDAWFAFSEPREMGRFSFYAVWITGQHPTVIAIGIFLCCLSFIGYLASTDATSAILTEHRRLMAAVAAFVREWRSFKKDEPERPELTSG